MIDHLDHLVLTTSREAACVDFYTRVLGMQLESFIGGTPPVERRAFKFGNQKINLHVQGNEFEPKAHLQACNWPIIEGPVARTGATSKIRSVYVRDPDFNLIELSVLI